MIFYKKYKTNFWHLLSCLRNAILAGQNTFVYSLQNLRDYKMFVMLQREGIIRGFEVRGNYIVFNLRSLQHGTYRSFTKPIFGVAGVRREQKKATLKHKTIVKLCNRKGQHPFYILNTDAGFVSNWSAKRSGVGGFPLVKIV